MPRILPTALVAVLTALVSASAASAATVRMDRVVERDEGRDAAFGQVFLSAAAGEVNTVTFEYQPQSPGTDAVVVRDLTTPLVAGARCQQVDANTVRCADPSTEDITEVEADLGDQADRADTAGDAELGFLLVRGGDGDDTLRGFEANLEGGDGHDTLAGASGSESLDGGAGDDVLDGDGDGDHLHGGPGDDVLRGGDGADQLYSGGALPSPAPAGRDRLEGGPGADTLSDQDELGSSVEIGPDVLIGGEGVDHVQSYNGRSAPVRVDLRSTAGQGQAGEGDTLDGIENVTGGARADTLVGDGAANDLDGAKGRDVLRGGGGDDRLRSDVSPAEAEPNAVARQYGPDRVFGDAGADRIDTLPTVQSVIACGAGEDRVAFPGFSADRAPSSSGPLVSRDCERLSMPGATSRRSVTVDPAPRVRAGDSLLFALPRARCCTHRLLAQTTARRPRLLGSATIRRSSVRLRVGRAVLVPARARRVRLRAKITDVNRNRFVWRFEVGRGAF